MNDMKNLKSSNPNKYPLMLHHLSSFPNILEHIIEDEKYNNSYYDKDLCININKEDNEPLHLSLSKQFPTSVHTPGKTLPAGYTRTGKWKPPRWSPAKTDKRAGK